MGFGPLRVINEDKVAPGGGFPAHPHQDMEIISYVVEGGLEHRDSLGTGSVIRPATCKRMSAGTGVRHSEFNASDSEPVHFLQIWIIPEKRGIAPSYEQKSFADAEKQGRLRLIGSRDGRDGSLTIHQTSIFTPRNFWRASALRMRPATVAGVGAGGEGENLRKRKDSEGRRRRRHLGHGNRGRRGAVAFRGSSVRPGARRHTCLNKP